MAASVGWEEEDEWEAINNDGFVYKRKKRHRPDPPPTTSSDPPDNNTHIKNKKRRRKETLLKLKQRYKNEISQWELLSNTFKAFNEKRENINGKMLLGEGSSVSFGGERERLVDSAFRARIDEMAIRVEADHAIIQGISNLCDVAEAICDAQEQHLKKEYLDLPIWVSPQEIMAVLCDTHSQTENGEGRARYYVCTTLY